MFAPRKITKQRPLLLRRRTKAHTEYRGTHQSDWKQKQTAPVLVCFFSRDDWITEKIAAHTKLGHRKSPNASLTVIEREREGQNLFVFIN